MDSIPLLLYYTLYIYSIHSTSLYPITSIYLAPLFLPFFPIHHSRPDHDDDAIGRKIRQNHTNSSSWLHSTKSTEEKKTISIVEFPYITFYSHGWMACYCSIKREVCIYSIRHAHTQTSNPYYHYHYFFFSFMQSLIIVTSIIKPKVEHAILVWTQ